MEVSLKNDFGEGVFKQEILPFSSLSSISFYIPEFCPSISHLHLSRVASPPPSRAPPSPYFSE